MNKRVTDRVCDKFTQERTNKVRHRKVFGDFCTRDEYGHIIEVRCRMCKTPIAGMVPIKSIKRTLQDGQIKEEVFVAFRKYQNFANIPLSLENGAQYDPNLCVSCEKQFNVHDEELLDACFCADIESWARGHEIQGKTPEEFQKGHEEITRFKVAKGKRNAS